MRGVLLKDSLWYVVKWIFICSLIGLVVGSVSAGFLFSLAWVTHYRENHLWLIAFLPLGGLFIGWLYHHYGKHVDEGNHLIIDTIHRPQAIIPFRMAPFIYLSTLLTHLLGGSVGREGTALQMAGSIADQLTKPLKLNPTDRKVLLIAAIAAGFGSVFGTPLAGALFALEVLLMGRLRYNALFPAFLAAIFANLIAHLWHAKHVVYPIGFVPPVSGLSIVYSVIVCILFGLCGAFFSKGIHFVGHFFKTKIAFPLFRPLIGGIVVSLAVLMIGSTKYIGIGEATILQSFSYQSPFYDFILKMLFTILTLSAGFKGGEVTPLFFIGATLGSALSLFIPLPTGLLAGMGFVAVFAGVANTPLACFVMAIEMFGASCGIYVAIACAVSYLFSGHHPIYGRQTIIDTKIL